MKAIFWNGEIENNFIGHIMSEIYRDGIYNDLVKDKTDLVVLDIGANIGMTVNFFSKYAKRVVAVEPSAEHFECLSKMIEFNGLKDKVTAINKALHIKNGKFPLFHNQNRTMFSLSGVVQDGSGSEMVDCITIDQIFEETKLDHVDLLKLDIEGTEPEILAHPTFLKVSPKIDKLIMETHQWSGRNKNQILEALEEAGFAHVTEVPSAAGIILATK